MSYSTSLNDFFQQLPLVVRNVLKEYEKPIFENRFLKYKEYILNDSDTELITFDNERWERRPYLFCFDHYGEDFQYLHPVILTMNTIKSMHHFLSENVKDTLIVTPSLNLIKTILNKY